MKFAQPEWLWMGLAACALLGALMFWSARQQRRALARVSARPAQLVAGSLSKGRRHLKRALLVLAASSLFIALARPQWGYHEEARRAQGVDLLFALDTSKSMLAEDLRPNRLARAKLAIEELSSRAAGDRLGLIAFAGDAFLQTPLTHDRRAFLDALSALDTRTIPIGGTDLASAIGVARRALRSEPDHQKVLVLLTDGEDLSGAAREAARAARRDGLTVHTVGIGSELGSEIPLRDARGSAELLRGPDGELVHSRLDAALLRELAALTGGSYHALGASGEGLRQLYRDQLAKLKPQTRTVHKTRVYHERFQWPLAAGLALLLIEWLIGDRRARRKPARAWRPLAMTAALLALFALDRPEIAAAADRAPLADYNGAAARYRKGNFDEAARGYRRALATRDLALQERSYYDLGNALYRVGQRAKTPAETSAKYREAIGAYDAALALKPDDADARFNRDFVKQRLLELEQQQPRQQGQPQQSDKSEQRADSKPQQGGAGAAPSAGGGSGEGAQGSQGSQDSRGQRGEPQQAAAGGRSARADQGAQGADARDRGSDAPSAGAEPPGAAGKQGAATGKEQPPQIGGEGAARPHAQAEQGEGAGQPGGARAPRQADREPGAQTDEGTGEGPRSGAQAGEQADEGQGPAGAQSGEGQPGLELTRAQAEQLLDALQGELRRLPSREVQSARDDRPRKDW
jgi:Ca-activated chloride channel family protein